MCAALQKYGNTDQYMGEMRELMDSSVGEVEPFEVNRKFWSHNLQLSKISSFSLRGGKITVGKTQGGGKTLASRTKVAG